jgi:phosphotransferase system HPr-like phosphotransfer protein
LMNNTSMIRNVSGIHIKWASRLVLIAPPLKSSTLKVPSARTTKTIASV